MRLALVTAALLALMCVSEIEAGTMAKKLAINLDDMVAAPKDELDKAGQPSGLSRRHTGDGYEEYTAYDLAWQALHMAAAAACRASAPGGGTGCCDNKVLSRNTASGHTCKYVCCISPYTNCDAEVSIDGEKGRATHNAQIVGAFYNYGCDQGAYGGSEPAVPDSDIMESGGYPYYSFCCCRK